MSYNRDEFVRELAQLLQETAVDHVVRDMAGHVGDQIFELQRRHGLAMASEAAATAMSVLAAVQVLSQGADQCNRAAEEDCTEAVAELFLSSLPANLRDAIAKALLRSPSNEGRAG